MGLTGQRGGWRSLKKNNKTIRKGKGKMNKKPFLLKGKRKSWIPINGDLILSNQLENAQNFFFSIFLDLGRREKPAWNSQKCKSFIWEKMNQSPIIDDNPVSNSPTKPAVQSWTPSVSQEDSISRLVCRSSIETARHQRGPILPNEPDSVQRARWKSSCPSQRGISSRTRSESPTPVLGLKQVNLGEKNPENSRWKSHKWTAIDKNERRSSRWG